jgi:hypothetical protein
MTMDNFLKIYTSDNNTIHVVDNSTGTFINEIVDLDRYNIQYSYYSENNEFTTVSNSTLMPPFTKYMVVKMELRSK